MIGSFLLKNVIKGNKGGNNNNNTTNGNMSQLDNS